jgi:hypothetical protein
MTAVPEGRKGAKLPVNRVGSESVIYVFLPVKTPRIFRKLRIRASPSELTTRGRAAHVRMSLCLFFGGKS